MGSKIYSRFYTLPRYSCSVLMAIFPDDPGLAGNRMFPFWVLVELRVVEVVTTAAIRRAKRQSTRHYQQTNTQFLQVGCPSCRPTSSVKSLKIKLYTPVSSLNCLHHFFCKMLGMLQAVA